jgi:hypothetical protein
MTRALLVAALFAVGCGKSADGDGDGFPADVDCEDGSATTFPGADETCNGADDDCDGVIDNDPVSGGTTFYADSDGDTHGNAAATIVACTPPNGYVSSADDCDDGNASVNPTGTEQCGDGLDNNCNGFVDGADGSVSNGVPLFHDVDGDGFGADGGNVMGCVGTPGLTPFDGDCDDAVATTNPAAAETCDSVDNDCDGAIDDSPTDGDVFYLDHDEDGSGTEFYSVTACDAPTGFAATSDDCDDFDATVGPTAAEVCDGADNDCDGNADDADDDVTDALTFYADVDGDGFGDHTTVVMACEGPSGTVDDASDCDDTDGAINADAAEVCDSADNDCDGAIDDADSDLQGASWYTDADGDGLGDPASEVMACSQPSNTIADGTDCDDTDQLVLGPTDYYPDLDFDLFGDDSAASTPSCVDPGFGWSDDPRDCDDTDSFIRPDTIEVCGYGDDNCDGLVDEDDPTIHVPSWGPDADSDFFADATQLVAQCDPPQVDWVQAGFGDADCDDTNPDINPFAFEVCDGVDDDCDGNVDDALDEWYADVDADGFGDPASQVIDCVQPSDTVADATDCDDTDAAVNPDGTEIPYDGVDQNCDGANDDDADADGYVDLGHGGDDCDDADAGVHPWALEVTDTVDNDCDGDVDGADAEQPMDLVVGDEGSAAFDFGMTMSFCGVDYDAGFAHGNGLVTFGDVDENVGFGETTSMFSTLTAIGLWDDLDPTSAGVVSVVQYSGAVGVYWSGVPEYLGVSGNDFAVILFDDGHARFQSGALTIAGHDSLVGWSCGAFAPGTSSDLSAATANSGALGIGDGTEMMLFEDFTDPNGSTFDLSSTVLDLCLTSGVDADGDGFTDACGDTDDNDASVHP